MNSLISRSLSGALVVLALGARDQARAELLTVADASELVQSTASDLDVAFLGSFVGLQPQPPQTLNYSSTSTATSWSATLTGTYLGSSLDVAYAGDLSNYPAGAVTWTSAGTYAAESWSGSGAATITDTSSTTFQVNLVASLAVGANTASIDYLIPGTVLPDGTEMYGSPGFLEAGSGPSIEQGKRYLNDSKFSWFKTPSWLPDIPSDLNYQPFLPFIPIVNDFKVTSAPIPPDGPFTLTGTITAGVPEPSSFVVFGLCLFGAFSTLTYRNERHGAKRND